MRMRIGIATAAVVVCAVLPRAQTTPRVSLPRTESRELVSKINDRTYQISVSLPPSYAKNPAARFPVIYLTDANWTFAMTVQTHFLLQYGGLVPEALIVGIVRAGLDEDTREGNPAGAARTPDLTPTPVKQIDVSYSAEYKRDVHTGEAPAFLRLMREELIPEIEQRYRTNGDRTFIGYSLGGLFGAYAMLSSPETFGRMILVCPSLWWDDNLLLKSEAEFAAGHKSLPVRLFMSDAELERKMAGTMLLMASAMVSHHYQGLQLTTKIFEGERHLSAFPVAVTRGLQAVFAEAPKP